MPDDELFNGEPDLVSFLGEETICTPSEEAVNPPPELFFLRVDLALDFSLTFSGLSDVDMKPHNNQPIDETKLNFLQILCEVFILV